MQQVAEPWLVLSMSGSPILLGLDAFAMDAPVWVLTLFGGMLADHADRRRVIFVFQTIQMLCPLILVFLILMGWVHIWMIILLSLIVGITDALSMPAFQSIVPLIVDRDQIENGIALNSAQFNLSRVLGPAFAGILMVHYGALGCFAGNAFSYIPFLAVILWILPKSPKVERYRRKNKRTDPWYAEISLISKDHLLRRGLLTILVTSLLCGPLIAFVPVLIKNIFHSDASHFGSAISSFGVGGILGALAMLELNNKIERLNLSSICAIAYAITVIFIALNRSLIGLTLALVIGGAALTMATTSVNSILQRMAEDKNRGQTSSLFMLSMRGGLSLGSLLTGFSVHFIGVTNALLVNGTLAIVLQVWIYFNWTRMKTPSTHLEVTK